MMGPGPPKLGPIMGSKEVRRTDGPVLFKRPLGSKLLGEGTVGDGLEEGPPV